MKRFPSIKAAIIIVVVVAVVLLAIGPVRIYLVNREVNAVMKDAGISIMYECSPVESREELLAAIGNLAVWESETRNAINQAYGHTDKEYSESTLKQASGYESREELLKYCLEKRWRQKRYDLRRTVDNSIAVFFGDTKEAYGINLSDVQACYSYNYFGTIVEVMQALNKNDGEEAYLLARYGLSSAQKRTWRDQYTTIPMDIAYTLKPELIITGCESALASTKKEEREYYVNSIVESAEYFEERYGVSVEGLSNARAKRDRLEYANRPDIPAVGMSYSRACSTKLGSPTSTTKDTGSWAGKKHTYGDMYWKKGGRQIFKAHYYDGEITDVWDTRSSTGNYYRPSSGSSRPSSSSFDPDDHDIEAYYDDNRDEYDDYDDAYDGFLDDEGAWDDY